LKNSKRKKEPKGSFFVDKNSKNCYNISVKKKEKEKRLVLSNESN